MYALNIANTCASRDLKIPFEIWYSVSEISGDAGNHFSLSAERTCRGVDEVSDIMTMKAELEEGELEEQNGQHNGDEDEGIG